MGVFSLIMQLPFADKVTIIFLTPQCHEPANIGFSLL
jgi:hypothetical protein